MSWAAWIVLYAARDSVFASPTADPWDWPCPASSGSGRKSPPSSSLSSGLSLGPRLEIYGRHHPRRAKVVIDAAHPLSVGPRRKQQLAHQRRIVPWNVEVRAAGELAVRVC